MSEDRKRKLKTRLLTATASVVLLGVVAALVMMPEKRSAASVQANLPPSEPVFAPTQPEMPKAAPKEGDISPDRSTIEARDIPAGKERFTSTFSIRATDMPATIKTVTMPYATEAGIRIDAANCEGVRLEVDEACLVQFIYDPAIPGRVDGRIAITAASERSDGSIRNITKIVSVDASAITPIAPIPTAIPAAPAIQPSYDPAAEAVLRSRRSATLLASQYDADMMTHMGPQRPQEEDWTAIGFKRNSSTYPVDMTRVVTMDKPIPAVIQVPIDTRNPSRAIASVERDIYGGDGRLVVIERGSKLIGTVQSVSTTGEEKVSITWQRLVRPDGAVFGFQATSGDAMGRAGIPAHIDNRWMERFGSTMLMSALNVAVTLGLDGTQEVITSVNPYGYGANQAAVAQDARAVATQQFRQDAQPLIQQFAQEQLQLPPIRTIPVGTRITVYPSTDLWLKPINPTEQMREAYASKVRQSAEYQKARTQLQRSARGDGAEERPNQIQNSFSAPIGTNVPAYLQRPGVVPNPAAEMSSPIVRKLQQAGNATDDSLDFITAPSASQQIQTRQQQSRQPFQQQTTPVGAPISTWSPSSF